MPQKTAAPPPRLHGAPALPAAAVRRARWRPPGTIVPQKRWDGKRWEVHGIPTKRMVSWDLTNKHGIFLGIQDKS